MSRIVLATFFAVAGAAHSAMAAPSCLVGNRTLSVNNDQVVEWKR
jgi:hypothetical protein